MKKFKKLIPALCMLLVSAVMLGSTTFAWFSMNTTVTASGMKVEATADQVYLQIQNKGTAFSETDAQTGVTTKVESKKLLPTNVVKTFDKKSPVAFDGGTGFTWVSNFSADPGSATKAGDYTEVSAENLTNYALKFEYTIRLKPGTGASKAPGKLKVAEVKFANDTANTGLKGAVAVLVVCGEYSAVYKQTTTVGTFTKSAGDEALSAAAFDSTEGTDVAVYVFFDGENANCTTNNIVLNDKFSVEITFNCNAD